ncbi:hypothetical protein B0H15DRAFT_951429 [Mycena belliarum]|uniref:Uncharacterized protein n=1 Tax=Mycena belliarum TaxID=1033014 RepID=A0AAD6U2C3_9AGAR|nr:hypothetical protein B0H15DRAFT_951429 [Mycena belliae]
MVSPQRISMLAIPHRILSSIFPSRAQPSRHRCFRSSRPWHVKGTLVVVPRAASRSSFVPKITPVIAVFVAVARGTSKITPVIAIFVAVARGTSKITPVIAIFVAVARGTSKITPVIAIFVRPWHVKEITPVIAVFVAVARGTSKITPVIAVFVRPWHIKEIPPVIAVFVAHRFALPFVLPSPVRHAVPLFLSPRLSPDDFVMI